jgi:hypothetical protein
MTTGRNLVQKLIQAYYGKAYGEVKEAVDSRELVRDAR